MRADGHKVMSSLFDPPTMAVDFRIEAWLDQIAHEAKGRIMEGQTDRDVLVWVLNQISTDEVIL